MTIQFPSYQHNIFKLGIAALGAGLLGGMIFKEAIKSKAKEIFNSFSQTKPTEGLKASVKKQAPPTCPKLLLYFDINKTLIFNDSVKKEMTLPQMALAALAQSTVGKWDMKHEPMSWEHYVHTVLVPGKDSDDPKVLKIARHQKIYAFLDWLAEQNHPLKEEVLANYQRILKLITDPDTKQGDFKVFDSFYLLLMKLRSCQVPFSVILMTFGDDLKKVTDEVAEHPEGIKFANFGHFKGKQLHLQGKGTIDKVDTMFRTFLASGQHFALRANYDEWHEDGEKGRSGKTFLYDSSVLALFFDDNITLGDKDIVNPINVSGETPPSRDLSDQLIKVDPAKALLNPDYFIEQTARSLYHHGYKEKAKELFPNRIAGSRVRPFL